MLHCVFILSLFYNIVFSLQNVGGNQKLLLPFQVCGNDMVTEPSLQPNFGVCKTIPVFYLLVEKPLGHYFKVQSPYYRQHLPHKV